MEESTPKKQKPIRLTKTEAYAMQMERPKKKKLTFWLIGLVVAAALGAGLWVFQDTWLPYWLPSDEKTEIHDEPASPAEEATLLADSVPLEAPTGASLPLNFLSATAWDHPQYHKGVRLFNQALDRYRTFLNSPRNPSLLAQAAKGTRLAGRTFQSLKPVEPSDEPLTHPLDQCRRLMKEVQTSQQALRIETPKAPAVRPAPLRIQASELEQHTDFKKGARQFNQALDQFNQYKANTSRKELLKPTEDLAREAAQTFEALKRQAPVETYEEIDRHIHQCYGIVSACRQQQLEAEGAKAATPNTFNRGTAGPSRRPVLPAYQPPQ
jgi:hypothetical protein